MSLYKHLVYSEAKKIIESKNEGKRVCEIVRGLNIERGKVERCLVLSRIKVIVPYKNYSKNKFKEVFTYSFKKYKDLFERKKIKKKSEYAEHCVEVYKDFLAFCLELFNKKILGKNVKRSAMEYIKEFRKAHPDKPYPRKSWIYKMANSEYYDFEKKWFPNLKKKDLSEKSKHERMKPEKYRPIEERPPKHELRKVPGNFEIDSVIGKRTDKQAMLTMIDICTGKTFARFYDRTMQGFRNAFRYLIRKFKIKINTLTMDNGGENNLLHEVISRKKMFNCHPYNSGEKGTLENRHRLIRRIIPKSTSLDNYTNDDLEEVLSFINNYYSKTFNKL